MVKEQNRLKFDETLGLYIDFHAYGDEVAKGERGVFTDSGYLQYQGYDPEMGAILAETIGYYPENQIPVRIFVLKLYFPLYMELLQGVSEMGARPVAMSKKKHQRNLCLYFYLISSRNCCDSRLN